MTAIPAPPVTDYSAPTLRNALLEVSCAALGLMWSTDHRDSASLPCHRDYHAARVAAKKDRFRRAVAVALLWLAEDELGEEGVDHATS